MPTTEDSLQVSHERFREMQAERRWEIYTASYGTDHRPEAKLEDAVKAHLARHGHPADAPLPAGRVTEWRDGQAVGPPRPLHVELASLKEIADKSQASNSNP
ncbi:MAG TPA: hypothetical protein VMR25_15645 [Planctomycetaceae bacterium]|jgi:hypothetical protein|nr:hypothetical protein [Planctomycetaceae bacterium]